MIGIDIVSISRIEEMIDRFGQKALNRFLTENEIKIAKKPETIAGFWAAKEAFSKAIGTGIGKEVSFLDIEISKTKKGQPLININEDIKKKFNISKISLSITHDGGFAIAAVMII